MRRLFAAAAITGVLGASSATLAEERPEQCAIANEAALETDAPARVGRDTPIEALAAAHLAARQRPAAQSFERARQIYTYSPGSIYELYANPGFVSAILLEPGEVLNDVAAGDTARWMVTQAEAEGETEGRTIVLVKPQAAGLRTNIVIVTSRRTYTIEAIAQSGRIYSAETAWCYPGSQAPPALNLGELNHSYRIRTIRGARPPWAPLSVFDDGRRTWIELPVLAASVEAPPLFVITGEGAELVNYRLDGNRYLVDRLFDTAELRLGTRAPVIVRIERVRGQARRQTARRGR